MPPAEPSWRYLEVLSEPRRRAVFEVVVDADAPVTRDDVAAACGISRELAAFHLDKLLEAGLLISDFARPKRGIGATAGRPAKRYRPADLQFHIHVPPRDYLIASRILADAHARLVATGEEAVRNAATTAASAAAHAEGQRIGMRRREEAADQKRTSEILVETLAAIGFRPRVGGDAIRLANCPFDDLAKGAGDVMCPANTAFIEGIVAGVGAAGSVAAEDAPGARCCVVVKLAE